MNTAPPREILLKQIDKAMGQLATTHSILDMDIYAVLSHCQEYLTLDAAEIERLNQRIKTSDVAIAALSLPAIKE